LEEQKDAAPVPATTNRHHEKESSMQHVTLETLCDILEVMTIERSIDCGFAITHFGDVGGQPTIAISHKDGTGPIIQ
jgi:hypothetical protein